MLGAGTGTLDTPTLFFVAICIAALLGLFLIFAWLQERNTRALAWWGAAYLFGASSLALWNAPAPILPASLEVSGALMFLACGMIWNGVRLFHGRRPLLLATFAGAAAWLVFSHMPGLQVNNTTRAMVGAIVIAGYTFCVARELWSERRKAKFSRTAAIIVPFFHAAIFLMPIFMKLALPVSISHSWLQILALETIIYAVGTAFIVLVMVKDHQVVVHRTAASTDPLTGLLNRRAFMEEAILLSSKERKAGGDVTLMIFDLDRFKSINDTYGHPTGDEALRTFAASVRDSMRLDDIIGRFGGEEFATIVATDAETGAKIAERVRAGFEAAGREIAGHPMGATVSIGMASARAEPDGIERLIARADSALYLAKRGGRNRVEVAAPWIEAERPKEESPGHGGGELRPVLVPVERRKSAAIA